MKTKKQRKPVVLAIVHKNGYPEVNRVVDGTKEHEFEVTKRDVSTSKRYDHNDCALAVCAKRTQHLTGVIISRHTAYLIRGKTAERYMLPESVSREVVSFDRGAGFEPGIYRMRPPSKAQKLGVDRGKGPANSDTQRSGGLSKRFVHITGNIRTDLRAAS